MNWRNTLILAVIALAGFAYFRFFEMKRPSTEEAKRQAQNVVNFDRNKVDGIVIKNGDQQIEIRRRENKWRLETPIKDQADGALVDNLLSDLENWEKEGTIPAKDIEADKSKLTEYGLNNPKLKLKLLGRDKPPEIWFGKDAALEGRMYVRLQNSKETFLARQSIRKDIDKKPEEFRDRKLTDLTTAQVCRSILKTPAGEMELEKKGDHWDILKPLRARADDQKVGDLIAQITTARIQQFVADDRGDLRPYGLAEPRGSITLFDEAEKKDQKVEIGESIKVFGREDKGQTLQIGSVPEKEKDQIYVRFAPRGSVYTLPKKTEEILNTKPADLRDNHLVRIDTNILDRITIDAPGKGKTVPARKNGNWTIAIRNNVPADSGAVRRLIDTLQNERVTRFVEDVASNLPKYGFDKPQTQLTFSSFASENTAEKELLLERDQNNQWHWLKRSGEINQANVQSLLNALSSLHAVRWLGATTPQHGFANPQLVLAFTTSPDNKTSHKLTIGAQNNDGTWCARVDGREGTFAISNSDLNTLRLPLEAQATASPPPTTTPVTSVAP